jgi:hypothetical protein
MKRALAVALLLMSFASIAVADGPDLPPVSKKPPVPGILRLTDGPDLPPGAPNKPAKPPAES